MYHEAQAQRINRLMRSLIEEHRSKARALLSSVEVEGHLGPSVDEGEDKEVIGSSRGGGE